MFRVTVAEANSLPNRLTSQGLDEFSDIKYLGQHEKNARNACHFGMSCIAT